MLTPPSEEIEPVLLTPALVVENDPAMQERLRYVLGTLGCDDPQIAWADAASTGQQWIEKHNFGIALIDIGLPNGSGLELIGWLQANHPTIPAVAVSPRRSDANVFAALRAGAVSYLLKEQNDLELSIALRSIEQGGAQIDPAIAKRILGWLTGHRPSQPAPLEPEPDAETELALNPRERRILELVVQGLSNRDMAELLSVSRLTVECHAKNIYRKLAIGSRGEDIGYRPIRHGFLR